MNHPGFTTLLLFSFFPCLMNGGIDQPQADILGASGQKNDQQRGYTERVKLVGDSK